MEKSIILTFRTPNGQRFPGRGIISVSSQSDVPAARSEASTSSCNGAALTIRPSPIRMEPTGVANDGILAANTGSPDGDGDGSSDGEAA